MNLCSISSLPVRLVKELGYADHELNNEIWIVSHSDRHLLSIDMGQGDPIFRTTLDSLSLHVRIRSTFRTAVKRQVYYFLTNRDHTNLCKLLYMLQWPRY